MRLISDDAWGIMTVQQEAEGEPFEGKVAVAEVIRRRALKKYFSDGTIPGTVLYPGQFSGWNAKAANRVRCAKIDDDMPSTQECLKAWHDSANSSLTQDALLYFNPRLCKPDWNFGILEFVVSIGQHDFYRLKG